MAEGTWLGCTGRITLEEADDRRVWVDGQMLTPFTGGEAASLA